MIIQDIHYFTDSAMMEEVLKVMFGMKIVRSRKVKSGIQHIGSRMKYYIRGYSLGYISSAKIEDSIIFSNIINPTTIHTTGQLR